MEDKVIDSRVADDGAAIRRRRECLAWGRRYTTYERLEEVPLVVVKRSGVRQPFDRAKVVAGVRPAAVLDRLRRLDDVAYVRFASVYKGFSQLGHSQREVGELSQASPSQGR